MRAFAGALVLYRCTYIRALFAFHLRCLMRFSAAFVLPCVLALDLSPADQSKLKQLIVRRDKVEDQMGALVSSRRGAPPS